MPDGSPFVHAQAPALPEQDWAWIIRHAERFQLASEKQAGWAKIAKACVDALEGRQWSAADLAKLEAEGRPALVINKILPLFRLVVGYFANNRTDIKYLPGNDGSGTADIARVLSHVSKHISELNQLPYSQAEVFMDGIVTGRAYWDIRLDFRRNLLGKQPRYKGVLEAAAQKAGWGQPLAAVEGKKRGRGIAIHESFNTYVAEVAEVMSMILR